MSRSHDTRVLVLPSPRAALAEIERRITERADPLAERLLVLVPSGPTRVHVAGKLARSAGGALIGVRVGTLLGLALETLANGRSAARPTGLAGRIGLSRAIESSRRLWPLLERLSEGAEVGVRAAEELVRAGLGMELVPALFDSLAEALPEPVRERTRDLIAAAARRAPGGDLSGGSTSVFARAAELVRIQAAPDEQVVLLAPEVAVGAEGDFAEALLRRGATALFTCGARGAFVQRLGLDTGAGALDGAALTRVDAPEAASAARAAARRLAERIAAGVEPQDLLVVCADPDQQAGDLARECEALGVPLAAPGVRGSLHLARRPLAALARLLEEREFASAGVLASAFADGAFTRELVARGAVRLADARGAAAAAALDLASELGTTTRPFVQWNLRLTSFCEQHLRWDAEGALALKLESELDGLARTLAGEGADALELRGDEWATLVAPRLHDAALATLGGSGAGVQLLPPANTRGRTADTVVLLGFERGTFPRRRGEDPLLDEQVRRTLRSLLPDLANAADARAADEALLDTLLGAGASVVVVHARMGAKGRETSLAPALERRLDMYEVAARPAPSAGSAEDAEHGPLTSLEWARCAGLARSESTGTSNESAWRALVGPLHDSPLAAEAHAAVVLEHDSTSADLGGLGRVGRARKRSFFVTQLERFAECGWAAHLERELRLEAPPGGALTTPDARAVGIAVHAALEHLLGKAPVAPDASFDTLPSRRVERPTPKSVRDALKRGVAAAVANAEKNGQPLGDVPGAAAWLAERARPLLEIGLDQIFAAGAVEVLATEHQFELALATDAGALALAFRADLVAREDGLVVGTDFKTGTSKEKQKTQAPRTKALVKALVRGDRLQAAAYAAATGGVGRYLYLGGALDDDGPRSSQIDATAAREHLPVTVATLDRARALGAYLPRLISADLEEETQPTACGHCSVIDACVQGDTRWRERLRRFAEEAPARLEREGDAFTAAALGWFELYKKGAQDSDRGES